MGKTRIAVAAAKCVIAAGGRVAILVPAGLGYQWGDELRALGVEAPPILRSLWQYLKAWDPEGQQSPWFEQNAVLISHAFTNWRLRKEGANWRWALLPEVYAHWRKEVNGRWPREYCDRATLGDEWVQLAAKSIVGAVSLQPTRHFARRLVEDMVEAMPWPGALKAEEYRRDEQLRPWLESAVGLGLGVFDLVIIDEAHKGRAEYGGLNRLVEHVVLQSDAARRLAMTATPIELDFEQWKQMLGRIKANTSSASDAISAFADSVRRIRQCPSDAMVREKYVGAAKGFKDALRDYLLRRDKREDPWVREFAAHSGEGLHAYRNEREIVIETSDLALNWRKSVCAAEALSFVTRQSDDPVAKRLRLTLGNGHGIAALMDHIHSDDKEDRKQNVADGVPELDDPSEAIPAPDKRLQRAQWWREVMVQPFADGNAALLEHPAILGATKYIEEVCQRGEKVLVFGRFTRPLRALVDLLNAREMLRNLDSQQPWPKSKVHVNEWPAVEAAHRQLERPGALNRDALDRLLDKQYRRLEQQRRSVRDSLLANIEKGFGQVPPSDRVRALFDAFKKEIAKTPKEEVDGEENSLAVVARAMQELIVSGGASTIPGEYASAFADLIDAASDRDEGDANDDGKLDEDEAFEFWSDLEERLREEYSRPEGGFGRLMYGETKPATRRLLQLAFNRFHGHPKVLVAQSVVGREGLNLHKACRTVVLLHPEWNPGVVEQQIGRVDRIGSLWEHKLQDALGGISTPGHLPKIEIRSVLFRGTYDERNWQVLRDRWDDLRAQLHGMVLSPQVAAKYVNAGATIAEINAAAPDFSPSVGNA